MARSGCPTRFASAPGYLTALYTLRRGPTVSGQLRIAGKEGDAFSEGLCQQHAVEGIFVQRGQAVDVHRVLAGDRQLDVPVIEQAPSQQSRLDAEVFAPEGILDGDFPNAGGAEEEFVLRVLDLPARGGRQALGLTGGPEKELVSRRSFKLQSRRGPRFRLHPCC